VDLDKLLKLAKLLKLQQVRVGSKYLNASCPFARWKHPRGKDSRPSFGMRIEPDFISTYKCFGCDAKGSLADLCMELALLGVRTITAEEFLFQNEEDEWADFSSLDGVENVPYISDDDSDVYPEQEYAPYRGRVPKYALQRGLDLATCKAWDLGHDTYRKRLTFPVRRRDGKLVGIKGRTYVDHPAKYLGLLTWNMGKWLYGEHMLPVEPKQVVVVEGEIDAIKVWMAGFNPLGIMGGSPSARQVSKIVALGCDVVLLPDIGEVGRKWSTRLGDQLKTTVQVLDTKPATGCKDAGDMTPQQIQEAVAQARLRL
jgi:DNA primase